MSLTPERWRRIEPILERAMELGGDERERYLEQACQDDASLRTDVERLLAADSSAEERLPEAAVDYAGTLLAAAGDGEPGTHAEDAPRQLGPYRLDRRIGSGGMGQVYLGERDDGEFQQTVAVKLMRRGMTDGSSSIRFQSERQILAAFDHPGIARVFDGGVTDDRTPYLVMEHVDGLPVTEYCERHDLDLDRRLDVFIQICAAVQYAHERLVVHRDLKPSNILVTENGTVKLLDFGIAKLLEPEAAGLPHAALTRTGFFAMTPDYAAPEQIRGETITTATDVYALGVLFYEILTGQRPYRLAEKSPSEIEQLVCDDEPTRPSTAVTADTVGDAARAERRSRELRGDLDTILLKALRKEPGRRYRSAAGLAEDLERYRSGLPVEARPATLRYRVAKFVGRHRLAVAAAGLVALVLGMLVAGLVVQRDTAFRERNRASVEAEKSERVVDFLLSLFEAGDPSLTGGEELTARDLVDAGLERAGEMDDEPRVQARMVALMAQVYGSLGEYGAAVDAARRAVAIQASELGPDHEMTGDSRDLLGNLLRGAGRFDEAEEVLRANLDSRRRGLGPDHPGLLESVNSLGFLISEKGDPAAALPFLEEAVAISRRLPSGYLPEQAEALHSLGVALQRHGRFDESAVYLEEAVALRRQSLGDSHALVAESLVYLAGSLSKSARFEEATPKYEESLAIRRRVFGDDHESVAHSLNGLAGLLDQQGDYRGAAEVFREALEAYRKLLGPEHLAVAIVARNLAQALELDGRLDEAERLCREAISIAAAALGEPNRYSSNTRIMLGVVLQARGAIHEAERTYVRAYAELEDNPIRRSRAATELGRLLVQTGRADEAEELLAQALPVFQESVGTDHPVTARASAWLAASRASLGRADEARQMLGEALAIQADRLPADHPHLEETRELLGSLTAAD